MKPLSVFIGYDSREPVAYHVCSHSILSRSSVPVSITPIALQNLRGIYTRDRGPTESTEFSISRFLAPYLSNYEGTSIYCDSDMLWLADPASILREVELAVEVACMPHSGKWPYRFSPGCPNCENVTRMTGAASHAAWVVKHDYTPKTLVKMDGWVQTTYPKKNWSSLVVFSNHQCRALSVSYVNTASGLDLHRFNWLREQEVGTLPPRWNVLVGEENQSENPAVVHFTNGIPTMPGHENDQYADLWLAEKKAAGL